MEYGAAKRGRPRIYDKKLIPLTVLLRQESYDLILKEIYLLDPNGITLILEEDTTNISSYTQDILDEMITYYVKDLNSFAVLNTNPAAIKEHEKKMSELKRIKSTENEINTLKSEVSEIKSMLSKILEAVGGEK